MRPISDSPWTVTTSGAESTREKVYGPNSAKLLRAVGVSALFVAAAAAASASNLAAWTHGRALLTSDTVVLLLVGLVFLLVGATLAISVIRGLPRLILTPSGVRYETLFRASWADWSSLSGFTVTTQYTGRRRPGVRATALLVGVEASPSVLRRKKLSISDGLDAPIADIVIDLNRWHAAGPGTAPASPAAAVAADENRFGLEAFTAPWLTFALLGVLALIFASEQIFAVNPGGPAMRPSIQTLLTLGGLNRSLVLGQGEWYRLFTAPLLHGDLVHILSNGVALLLVGYPLERLVGRVWFFGLFVIGAIGGALMSMAVNPETMISVGASGAIMGLFAALLVLSFRLPADTNARTRMQVRASRVLVPSLLPLAASTTAGHIDYGAHIGGALSGTAVAFLLFRTWPDTSRLPQFPRLAMTTGAVGILLTVASIAAIANGYPTYQHLASLIPQNELPRNADELRQRAAALVARYPHDPRAHLFMATVRADDSAAAERELRIALAQAEELRFMFGPRLADETRRRLAEALLRDGRIDEAKETVRSLCRPSSGAVPDEKLRKALDDRRLCD